MPAKKRAKKATKKTAKKHLKLFLQSPVSDRKFWNSVGLENYILQH